MVSQVLEKTTFLKHLAVDWCNGKFQAELITVLIELRQIQDKNWNLLNALDEELNLNNWHQFSELKTKIEGLKQEIPKLKTKIEGLKQEIPKLETGISELKKKIKIFKESKTARKR